MKKIAFIFLLTISALFIIACKKYPELKIYKLIFENENIEYSANSAEIKVRYSYPTTLEYVNAILSQSNYMGYSTIAQAKIQDSIFIVNFVDLQEDTKYYYKFEYSNGVNVVSTDVRSFTIDVNHTTLPTVTTKTITNISATGAKCGGNITADGGSAVTARGVCWSTKENPTIYDSFTSDGAGSGSYVSTLTELIENTTYYVRAYAQNEHGTSYGNEMSFVAVGGSGGELPNVTTGLVTNITSTSAKCDGIVNTDGGSIVIARGVCWSTEHEPSINDDHTSNGSGVGEFNANITELTANTTYYVRAYATNENGTAYGDERTFVTQVGMPTVTTKSVTGITSTTASCGGEVTNDGGGTVTARGVCWSTEQNPTINDLHTSDGNGTGEFTSSITGLSNNITYYIRAYATNVSGTSYGEERSFTTQEGLAVVTTADVTAITATTAICGGEVTDDGGFEITARGICWGTEQNPTTSNHHTTDGTGVGLFTSNITDLTYNTTYYVRAYATNSKGTSYGEEKAFTTIKLMPTVTTSEVTDITSTTAVCGGNVTSDGGAIVTARGVCWSTTENPTIINSHTNDGTGVGAFNSIITGLYANTTYYVRAYAINAIGIAYGEQKMFTTLQELSLPTVTTSNVSNITSSSAVCGCEVTFNGNGIITARGVCWSTSTSPSLNDSHTNDGNGIGMFTSYLTDLNHSTVYYVRAYATNELGTSYGEIISFTTEQPTIPEGAIAGLFSVGVNHQVWFSQGNLQYQASTNIWRFAENQYDYIGESNNNISWIYNGWIDLFGWGTSGYNHGAVAYQPWSTSGNNADYYAYGDINNNLNDYTGQADWGYNPIYNGGNTENIWRTLSSEEWHYLLYQRGTYTGARFALAIVNDINGIILLPDYWNNQYTLNDYDPALGSYGLSYDSNIISLSDWTNVLEANGAVFLPAAGRRTPTNQNYDICCYYWTTTIGDNGYVCQLQLELPFSVYYNAHASRFYGNSVRLVHDVN